MDNRKRQAGPPPLPPTTPQTKTGSNQPRPQRRTPPIQTVRVTSSLPSRRKYPFLNLLRTVYVVKACIVTAVGVFWLLLSFGGVIAALATRHDAPQSVAVVFTAAVLPLIPGFLCFSYGVFAMATAEAIRVFLDIQQNTLTTARELAGLRNR